MAPLTQAEKDRISAKIVDLLTESRYACSMLTELTSGTTNLSFRGTLRQSLPLSPSESTNEISTISSVVIKYSSEFAAVNTDFPLDISRCLAEETMLQYLGRFPFIKVTTGPRVMAPRLLLFDRETNVQVFEDFPDSVDLKSVLVSPELERRLTQPTTVALGRELGAWLRTFHAWAADGEQADLRSEIDGNEPMRKLKYLITYKNLVKILDNFPDIIQGNREVLEEVQHMAEQEFARPARDGLDSDAWGLIHGDFWSGNILLPPPSEAGGEGIDQLFIIDWEFAQFGHRAYDLGQMIGDVFERKILKDAESALWIIQGLLEGYGQMSDEMVFRTAIHAGVQLVNWYSRKAPSDPLPGTPEQIEGIMGLGKDLIVRGWKKDRQWLRSKLLASLFSDGS